MAARPAVGIHHKFGMLHVAVSEAVIVKSGSSGAKFVDLRATACGYNSVIANMCSVPGWIVWCYSVLPLTHALSSLGTVKARIVSHFLSRLRMPFGISKVYLSQQPSTLPAVSCAPKRMFRWCAQSHFACWCLQATIDISLTTETGLTAVSNMLVAST